MFLFLTPQRLNILISAQGVALGIGGLKVFSPERALYIFGLLWLAQIFNDSMFRPFRAAR